MDFRALALGMIDVYKFGILKSHEHLRESSYTWLAYLGFGIFIGKKYGPSLSHKKWVSKKKCSLMTFALCFRGPKF
jgi:hypothetical protein